MTSIHRINEAATTLLDAHKVMSKKPPSTRTDFESHIAQMGFNRLTRIVDISSRMIKAKTNKIKLGVNDNAG